MPKQILIQIFLLISALGGGGRGNLFQSCGPNITSQADPMIGTAYRVGSRATNLTRSLLYILQMHVANTAALKRTTYTPLRLTRECDSSQWVQLNSMSVDYV